jgi:hypothetical protein
VDEVIRQKAEHEKVEQELQAWEIQEVREHLAQEKVEKEHAMKEKAMRDHEEQEVALWEAKAWKEHIQWEQGGAGVRAPKKAKKKVWAQEEVDLDDEAVICGNCKKWGVKCQWPVRGKGKSCQECQWQHVSYPIRELAHLRKKAKVRGGLGPGGSIPGLVKEFWAIQEEVRGVAGAINDLWKESQDQSKVLVQAMLAIGKEI